MKKFSLDLKKFKKVSSDEKVTTLHHEDGHKIQIAHSALTRAMKKQLDSLPKMADGGEVDDQEENQFGTFGRSPAGESVTFNPNPSSASLPDKFDDNQYKNLPETSEMPENQPFNFQTMFKNAFGVKDEPKTGAMDTIATDQAAPEAPAEPAKPDEFQLALDKYGKSAQGGANEMVAGARKSMKAAEEMGQGQAAQEQQIADLKSQQIEQAKALEIEQKASLQEKVQEVDNVLKDIQNFHIDPKHYQESMSSGDKTRTAIGLFLGGLGTAWTGHNPALDFLNKQIDRDIDSQKSELGKKHTILSAYMEKYKNEMVAQQMARATLYGIQKLETEKIAAASNSPIVIARAKMLSGELQMKMGAAITNAAAVQKEVAMQKAMFGMTTGQGKATSGAAQAEQAMNSLPMLRMMNPKAAESLEERIIPGVGVARIPVPKDERAMIQGGVELDHKLQELEEFTKKHSGSLNPAVINYGKSLAASTKESLRLSKHQGILTKAKIAFDENMIPSDPTKFFGDFRTLPAYEATRSMNRSELKNRAKSFGIQMPGLDSGSGVKEYKRK